MGKVVVSRRRQRPRRDARGNVREAFARQLREQWQGRLTWRHFGRIVARIEAGEEVVVPGWQVREFVRVPMGGHVRLELDGGVTVVEPVREGARIVAWRAAA